MWYVLQEHPDDGFSYGAGPIFCNGTGALLTTSSFPEPLGRSGKWRAAPADVTLAYLHVDDVRFHIFIEPMFAVRTADSGFPSAGMKALHRFEVLPINISFAKL